MICHSFDFIQKGRIAAFLVNQLFADNAF